MFRPSRHITLSLTALSLLAAAGCMGNDTPVDSDDNVSSVTSELTVGQKLPRYALIRDSARARGVNNAYLLAGIANEETGLAMCWSEATWACQGPGSPSCGGGPIIAGAGDGPCSAQQGGLGMFQFDAGTYWQTISHYGNDVLTIDGQVSHAIDYAVNMVWRSVYTTNAETLDKARQWINNFDPNNGALRDQWIKTVVRYYNGCPPGAGCWNSRYNSYSAGLNAAINDTGGLGFWGGGGGGGGSPCEVRSDGRLYCTNTPNAALRATPNLGAGIVNHLRTTYSWFECWTTGDLHAGGNTTWYRTLGDDNGNRGFVPAVDLATAGSFDADPSAHGLPHC